MEQFILDLICTEFFKKNNMKKLIIFLMIIGGLSYSSCESTTYQDLAGVIENPTYNANIAPIFKAECISCHSANSQYPPLETYEEVKDACENGQVLCRIEGSCGDIMPPSGKMPQATIDMINLWATNGYLEQ